MPVVIVPPPFQGPTRGESQVTVPATTVKGAMDAMEARFPGFAAQVFAPGGGFHSFVQLFKNGTSLGPEDLDQDVAEGDEIEVVAAIAGGREAGAAGGTGPSQEGPKPGVESKSNQEGRG